MPHPASTPHLLSILLRGVRAPRVPALVAVLLVLASATPVMAQVTVARFHGDYPGALCFTFDDALPTQLIYAAPYLDQVGLKGSFYLTTGNIVDGAAGLPAIGKPTVWADWKALADGGHEIGSHTITHTDLTTLSPEAAVAELTGSAKAIKEKLGITPVTLAYPYNARNAAVGKLALQTYIAARETQVGYGAEAGMANTAEAMNKYADAAVSLKALRIGMIHGLTEPYAPMDPAQFLAHLKYCRKLMDERKLWVATFAAISKYRIGRDSVRLATVYDSAAGSVTFTATTPLDPLVYDQPLTVIIPYTGGTSPTAQATRPGSAVPLRFSIEPGRFLVEAVPGPEPVTIKWTPAAGIVDGGRGFSRGRADSRTQPGVFSRGSGRNGRDEGRVEPRYLVSGRELPAGNRSLPVTPAADLNPPQ